MIDKVCEITEWSTENNKVKIVGTNFLETREEAEEILLSAIFDQSIGWMCEETIKHCVYSALILPNRKFVVVHREHIKQMNLGRGGLGAKNITCSVLSTLDFPVYFYDYRRDIYIKINNKEGLKTRF